MRKMFLGIIGCANYARKGWHQVCRDTFLTDAPKYPNLSYKFFIGDGTVLKGDDEASIQASCGGYDRTRGIDYGVKCRTCAEVTKKEQPYVPEADEVLLPCEDDFVHLPSKLRLMIQYAHAQGFDYFFRADSDDYIELNRLMALDVEPHDVIAHPSFGGGCGWILSRKAMALLIKEPIGSFIDEVWAGNCFRRVGLPVHGDERLSDFDVTKENGIICTHCGWMAGYVPQRMYDLHRRYRG